MYNPNKKTHKSERLWRAIFSKLMVNQLLFRPREIFARFVRASSLRIFLTAKQSFSYGCYNNTGLDRAWLRTLIVANQFI